jgi:D-3-phosphoglycerate dehydrogenase / 2-oxoglutarate reductase
MCGCWTSSSIDPMALRRVVVTQRFFDQGAISYLQDHGCEVVIAPLPTGQADGDVSRSTLLRWLDGAAGWIVGHARVTRELLEACPDLKIVARRGVGYERVDVAAVKDLGRVATIAAGGNDETVADQAIGLMIALGRRFRECQLSLSKGSWTIPLGTDLYRKTVGVVGLGRIGRAVVRRLMAFDARILVHTPQLDPGTARTLGFEYVDFRTLLRESDYVTLHAPLNAQTRFLIREETIGLMKPTAYLINTARGGLVEDGDLLRALQERRLAGAGLDVFMSESDSHYEPVTRQLIDRVNVVALPHAGASTREGLDRTNLVASKCVVAVLDGDMPPTGCTIADGRRSRPAIAGEPPDRT